MADSGAGNGGAPAFPTGQDATPEAAAAMALTFASRPLQEQQHHSLKPPSPPSSGSAPLTTNRAIVQNGDKIKGFWTKREQDAFVQGLGLHGKDWKKIQLLVKTRTLTQIRTHAQKYFKKLAKKDTPLRRHLPGMVAGSPAQHVKHINMSTPSSASLPSSAASEASSTAAASAIASMSKLAGVMRPSVAENEITTAAAMLSMLHGNKPNQHHTVQGTKPDGGNINYGRWTEQEQSAFVLGLELHGKNWKKIQPMVRTRTLTQIRTHAQKYYAKLARRQGKAAAAALKRTETTLRNAAVQDQNSQPVFAPGNTVPPAGATIIFRNVREV